MLCEWCTEVGVDRTKETARKRWNAGGGRRETIKRKHCRREKKTKEISKISPTTSRIKGEGKIEKGKWLSLKGVLGTCTRARVPKWIRPKPSEKKTRFPLQNERVEAPEEVHQVTKPLSER